MASLVAQFCVHHPDRAGSAFCMSCRKVVCQECATTWEGVNLCRPCLAARAAKRVEGVSPVAWAAWAVAVVLLLAAAGRLMAWTGAFVARAF